MGDLSSLGYAEGPTVFGLPATCLHCGHGLHLVNTTTNCSLAVGIMKCGQCGREYEVTCRMSLLATSRRTMNRRKAAA